MLGELNEFFDSGNQSPSLRAADNGDAASSPELKQAFIAKYPERTKDGVPVYAEDSG